MWQKIKNVYHAVSAYCAALFYGSPGKKLRVVGITGTDGKTTTTHLIHHILKTAGKRVSLISSVYAEIAGKHFDTGFHVTSPNEWLLQKLLRQACDSGDEFVVLEVTSHALDQYRVLGVDFEIGVLTNISHEHLDYHKSYKDYVKAKERLLKQAEVAIVNRDDQSYQYINPEKYASLITYGIKNKADVTAESFSFRTNLPGEYNRYNCLAAIAACMQLGLSSEEIYRGLETFPGVKGRFEKIGTSKGFEVIIDFAHTPNAFEQVLSTVKPAVSGRLVHVFGSAAKRDVTKRPIMGEKSAAYADTIVLTEEDYRTENVNEIIDQIAQGIRKAGGIEMQTTDYEKAHQVEEVVFFRIPDRQTAINFAIQKLAHPGDTVILTGKAHEKSMARGRVEYQWSEHEAVKNALERS